MSEAANNHLVKKEVQEAPGGGMLHIPLHENIQVYNKNHLQVYNIHVHTVISQLASRN